MAKVTKTTEEKVTKVKKPVKKVEVVAKTVAAPVAKPAVKGQKPLSVDVYDLEGKVAGKVTLPEAIFGEKVNKTLLAQAVRVYLANQRQGNASTKTRGEVEGSTRKIYRQKGTGKARHGSIRAPIFIKGGIVFGPKPRDFSLSLPTKMKRKALFSALSAKLIDGGIIVLAGLETITPKTKQFVSVLQKLEFAEKKRSLLLVTSGKTDTVKRAAKNVQGVDFTAATRLNAYEVLRSKQLVIMKDAIDEMVKTFIPKA